METDIKVSLLIVEDDRFIRKVYREILTKIEKLDIHELETAENILEYVKENKPDVVIMDYKLPGINGLEATKQIIMAHPDTIVLVISGDADKSLEDEMLEVGAVAFFRKPVRGKLLYFTVMNFTEIILTKKKLRGKINQQLEALKAEEKSEPQEVQKTRETQEIKEEKSETFVESFKNTGISDEHSTLMNETGDAKTASEFLSQQEGDYDIIDDFIDNYDQLKYTVETLETSPEPIVIRQTSEQIAGNSRLLGSMMEFPMMAHTLASIHSFLDFQDLESMSEVPTKKLAVFLCDFFEMYSDWVKSVFISKDAEDIHYMDVTLMSFGLQMDSIFSDINVLSEDDEAASDEGGSVEFF